MAKADGMLLCMPTLLAGLTSTGNHLSSTADVSGERMAELVLAGPGLHAGPRGGWAPQDS